MGGLRQPSVKGSLDLQRGHYPHIENHCPRRLVHIIFYNCSSVSLATDKSISDYNVLHSVSCFCIFGMNVYPFTCSLIQDIELVGIALEGELLKQLR